MKSPTEAAFYGDLMTDFVIGDVVKLKSGGHEMTVQDTGADSVGCVWSDGKQVRSGSFHPNLLVARAERITGINIVLVYGDKDIGEMVAEMRRSSKAADDTGFHVEDEAASAILKRRLGPKSERGSGSED
jgi:uncharacterized protein YodC (DUF2158 family)